MNRRVIDLDVEIRSVKTVWQFQVIEGLNAFGVDNMLHRGISFDFFKKTLGVNRGEINPKVGVKILPNHPLIQ